MAKAKTLEEIAEEYGVCEKTLRKRIREAEVKIKRGLLFNAEQKLIYDALGHPTDLNKNGTNGKII